jgi:hypothetical protein
MALPSSVVRSLENSKAEYRRLGNSGLHVSVPILGCMSIGNPEWADWVLDADKALPLLKAAYDRGVNTVRIYLIELPPLPPGPQRLLLALVGEALTSRKANVMRFAMA